MNFYSFLLLMFIVLFGLISIGISIFTWKRRDIPGLSVFPLISLGVVAWLFGNCFAALIKPIQEELFWIKVSTIGMDILPVAWLIFILQYTRGQTRLPMRTWILLGIFPIISQLIVWVSYFEIPIQPEMWLGEVGQFKFLLPQFSYWDWLHMLYSYGLLIAGAFLFIQCIQRSPRSSQIQIKSIMAGTLIPMFIYSVEMSGIRILPYPEITAVAFTIGQVLYTWSMLHGRASRLLPLARNTLIEAMRDGFLVLDEHGKIVYLNPAATEISDLHTNEAIGLLFTAVFPELQTPYSQSNDGTPAQAEIALGVGKDKRHFDVLITPVTGHGKFHQSKMVIFHDCSLRKQSEEALQESEERYRLVTSNLHEGIIMQNAFGNIMACNPSAEHILGMKSDQMVGRTPTDPRWRSVREDKTPLPDEEHPTVIALNTGKPQSNSVIGLHKPDGLVRWISMSALPLTRNGQNKPYAVVTTINDITDKKQVTQDLTESENKFRNLMAYSPIAMMITDEQGSICSINEAAEQLLGYQQKELLGKKIDILFPESLHHRDRNERRIDDAWVRPAGKRSELLARRNNGNEFFVEICTTTIETNEGTIVVNYIFDTTEQKQIEEEIQQTNDRLTELLKEIEIHNRELTLLSELGEMLQNCSNDAEVQAAVGNYSSRLFPDTSGALYQINDTHDLLEATICWGDHPPQESLFSPEMCWALRCSRVHFSSIEGKELECKHVNPQSAEYYSQYICVPMQAQGDVIGLLHLRLKADTQRQILEYLALNMAEQITMSLSNLALRDELHRHSIRDPLTGLHNRIYMEESFDREVRRTIRCNHPISLLLFDIDHFQNFNEIFGRAAGDALLRAIGAYMQKSFRGSDILCRYGGEEFAIILPDTNLEDSCKLAHRLHKGIHRVKLEDLRKPLKEVSISIGVSGYPRHGRSMEKLISAATQALKQAKQQGCDQVVVAE